MRTIEISVSRTYKKEDVLPDYIEKLPKGHKGDFPASAGPVDRSVPESTSEAVQQFGEATVYSDFILPQLRLREQNKLAKDIEDKILKPEAKSNRRGGAAVKVDLS